MKQPAVVFRTSVGPNAGLGHLRRCLTLAQALKSRGVQAYFAIDRSPSAVHLVDRCGFIAVEEDGERDVSSARECIEQYSASMVIVDSYAIEAESLQQIRNTFVAVLDDLGNRPLPVDLIVNGSISALALKYYALPETRLLLGPEYVLLRDEFALDPKRKIHSNVERVLVSIGGADPCGLTARAIGWVREALGPVAMDVVIGPFFDGSGIQEIEQMAQGTVGPVLLHLDPPCIRDLMLACDLAVAGGGQTTYELAATGTPTLAVRIADNQIGNLTGLAAKGVLVCPGSIEDEKLHARTVKALAQLAQSPETRMAMSRAGRMLVDGLGAKRVAEAIIALLGCGRGLARA